MNAAARVAIKRFARTHENWTPEQVCGYVLTHACATGPFRGDETLQDVEDVMHSMKERTPDGLL